MQRGGKRAEETVGVGNREIPPGPRQLAPARDQERNAARPGTARRSGMPSSQAATFPGVVVAGVVAVAPAAGAVSSSPPELPGWLIVNRAA